MLSVTIKPIQTAFHVYGRENVTHRWNVHSLNNAIHRHTQNVVVKCNFCSKCTSNTCVNNVIQHFLTWPWCLLFLDCFDTVGWVIWPVKTHPRYDLYCVGGTLSLNQSINPDACTHSACGMPVKQSVWLKQLIQTCEVNQLTDEQGTFLRLHYQVTTEQ